MTDGVGRWNAAAGAKHLSDARAIRVILLLGYMAAADSELLHVSKPVEETMSGR